MTQNGNDEILAQIGRAITICGGPSKFARGLNVSVQAVCFWRDGRRKFPTDLGAEMERMTGQVVTRRHVWPKTWHLIWPEMPGATEHGQALREEPAAAEQGA